jgi:hypothetical protein
VVYVGQVSADFGGNDATAAQLVMTVPPEDDAGAETADRYEWQSVMAAADGMAMYLQAVDTDGQVGDNQSRIVCERHEDWVLVQGNDAELVSAKHKDPSYGAYTTLKKLFDDGGLAHLFLRWMALDAKPTCRLVTTPGLSRGPAQQLEKACQYLRELRLAGDGELAVTEEHHDAVKGACEMLDGYRSKLPADWQDGGFAGTYPSDGHRDQMARFMSILSIDHGLVQRKYVGYAAPDMYAKPVIERLGLQSKPAEIWEAVLALFRARMRAGGPLPLAALPKVMAYRIGASSPDAADVERSLASRIITMQDIDVAIRVAVQNPGGFSPIPRLLRTSRVAVKMAAGTCTDNSIERAEQLRADYQAYWSERAALDPTARAAQERLTRILLRVSDEATTVVGGVATANGQALWAELQRRVDTLPRTHVPDDMDSDLLLGGVCELSNRCQVWFSDRFDVEAEVTRLREDAGSSS